MNVCCNICAFSNDYGVWCNRIFLHHILICTGGCTKSNNKCKKCQNNRKHYKKVVFHKIPFFIFYIKTKYIATKVTMYYSFIIYDGDYSVFLNRFSIYSLSCVKIGISLSKIHFALGYAPSLISTLGF